MIVPKTEHDTTPQFQNASGARKARCKHCGGALTWIQRITRAEFCSHEHAQSYRRKRSQQIAALLAAHAQQPRLHEKVMLASALVGTEAKPRIAPPSWPKRSAVMRWRQPVTAGSQHLMPAFSAEDMLAAADVKAIQRKSQIQRTNSQAAAAMIRSLRLPSLVYDHLLCPAPAAMPSRDRTRRARPVV